MTRIKICGLTRPEDVGLCVELGAHYLGFNFSAKSPRRVNPADIPALLDAAGDSRKVGIFIDEGSVEVLEAIDALRLDLLQIHRDLQASDFEFGRPVIAVSHVAGGAARMPEQALLARCHAILFDTAHPDRPGGTGNAFDWSTLSGRNVSAPVGLAGGLHAGNVEAAIREVRPFMVDVASGVESSPGRKDPAKLRAFFTAVERAG
jgi:phosphoribosylanthranilate isomerase